MVFQGEFDSSSFSSITEIRIQNLPEPSGQLRVQYVEEAYWVVYQAKIILPRFIIKGTIIN